MHSIRPARKNVTEVVARYYLCVCVYSLSSTMAHIQHLDELVREYLLFRGFTITLKSFDAELKVDKDRGFRVSFTYFAY